MTLEELRKQIDELDRNWWFFSANALRRLSRQAD